MELIRYDDGNSAEEQTHTSVSFEVGLGVEESIGARIGILIDNSSKDIGFVACLSKGIGVGKAYGVMEWNTQEKGAITESLSLRTNVSGTGFIGMGVVGARVNVDMSTHDTEIVLGIGKNRGIVGMAFAPQQDLKARKPLTHAGLSQLFEALPHSPIVAPMAQASWRWSSNWTKSAEQKWRKLKGAPRLAQVVQGVFKDGLQEAHNVAV